MTTPAEQKTITISNATFGALLETVGKLDGVTAVDSLKGAMIAAKNHKGHSRLVALDGSTANMLRIVVRRAQTPENERTMKTVTDKIDSTFPDEGAGTAVLDAPPAGDTQNGEVQDEVQGDAQSDTATSEPVKADKTPKAPKEPKAAPTALSRIKALEDGGIPDAVNDPELAALIVQTEIPNLDKYNVNAGDGAVRYRSKSRTTGTHASVIDLSVLKIAGAKGLGTNFAVVCEQHGVLLPLPNVRPGKRYIRRPGMFCATCATLDKPMKAEKPVKEKKQKAEKAPKLPKRTKVVEPVAQSEPDNDDGTPAVIHPSDERAPGEAWEAFSAQMANDTGATVTWEANRQYALVYGEGRDITVYVNAKGVEDRYRFKDQNFATLAEAKAALGL